MAIEASEIREQIKARGLALIGVLLSLAEGEGHYLDCEGSCEGIAVETGKAGAAQLKATVNSGQKIFSICLELKSQQSSNASALVNNK